MHYRETFAFATQFPLNCESGNIKEVEKQLKNLRSKSRSQIRDICAKGLLKATMPKSKEHSNVQPDIVRILLKHGINPCATVSVKGNTQTLLHTTVLSPNLANEHKKDIIEQFLEAGVDPDIQDSNGKSAYDIGDEFCKNVIDMFAAKNKKGPAP